MNINEVQEIKQGGTCNAGATAAAETIQSKGTFA